jgi:hypothetical protein
LVFGDIQVSYNQVDSIVIRSNTSIKEFNGNRSVGPKCAGVPCLRARAVGGGSEGRAHQPKATGKTEGRIDGDYGG